MSSRTFDHFRRFRRVALWTIALVSGLPPARAGEPFQAFVDGLRRRQMFDAARQYLEQSKTNPLVSKEARQRIAFETARVLIEEAGTLRDPGERTRRLDEAQRTLQEFIKANPNHPVAAEATVQLGTVLIERGRIALGKSRNPRQEANRAKLIAEARQQFDQAQQVFADAEARFEAELKKFPKVLDPKDREAARARDQTRLNFIQAQMYSAMVQYDQTKLLDEKSDAYEAKVQAAAKKYETIYSKYKTLLAGLYARMHQARCLLDLGNTTDALTYAQEVLAQAEVSPDLRPLATKTLPVALECWLHEKEAKYDKAIEAGNAWLAAASRLEEQTPEGLAILWLTAQAHKRQADATKHDKKKRDADLREAARLAAKVAGAAGPYQEPARELTTLLRHAASSSEPTTFAEAFAQGQAAVDELAATLEAIKLAESPGGDRGKLAALETTKQQALARGASSFAQALSLRGADVSIDQVNEVRYFQAYLHYTAGRCYDAAVLGEFLARKYPKSSRARQAAKIALAAYLQAYNDQPADSREVEMSRMTAIAQLTAAQWPDQPDAAEDWMLLADLALRSGDIAAANQYLANIPADSPARAEADLKQGQALWAEYLAGVAAEDGKVPAPSERLLAQARTMLQQGTARRRQQGGPPDYNLLAAEVSLAQVYNTSGEYAEALKVLERPETGPLALVGAKDPLTGRANLGSEILKCALRAYVGAQRLDRAEQVMHELDQRYATQPDGAAALTRLYVSLGHELEGQLKQLQAAGKSKELDQVLAGFQKFLDEIAKRDSNSASTLSWIGETCYRLGSGLQGEGAGSRQAEAYFARSVAAYQKLLDAARSDSKLASTADAIRLRLARSQRAAGQYEAALQQLGAILKNNPNLLDCQVEAARTYQLWGRQVPQRYQQAIHGTDAASGVPIWGWNGLRRRLEQVAKYKDRYEEARFNVADCSFRLALSKEGAARQEALSSVERLVGSFARLDPQLGGPEWRARYDILLKDIQRASGRQPEGLSALPPASTARSQATPAG
jgi:hypothetical protein